MRLLESADNAAIMLVVTIKAQAGWDRAHVLRLARGVSPGWLDVSVREDPWRGRISVTLRVRPWWRRLVLGGAGRSERLVAVVCALADAPAGVLISVGWA